MTHMLESVTLPLGCMLPYPPELKMFLVNKHLEYLPKGSPQCLAVLVQVIVYPCDGVFMLQSFMLHYCLHIRGTKFHPYQSN